MSDEIKRLNRFTTLPVLLYVLDRKKLVLINPSLTWEDRDWQNTRHRDSDGT